MKACENKAAELIGWADNEAKKLNEDKISGPEEVKAAEDRLSALKDEALPGKNAEKGEALKDYADILKKSPEAGEKLLASPSPSPEALKAAFKKLADAQKAYADKIDDAQKAADAAEALAENEKDAADLIDWAEKEAMQLLDDQVTTAEFYYSFLSPFNLSFQTILFSVFSLIFIYFSNKKI